MTKELGAILMLLLLSGCLSEEEIRAQLDAVCVDYGFTPDTDAYTTCLQNEFHELRDRQYRLHNSYNSRYRY